MIGIAVASTRRCVMGPRAVVEDVKVERLPWWCGREAAD
jgi:hypothetical protein